MLTKEQELKQAQDKCKELELSLEGLRADYAASEMGKTSHIEAGLDAIKSSLAAQITKCHEIEAEIKADEVEIV